VLRNPRSFILCTDRKEPNRGRFETGPMKPGMPSVEAPLNLRAVTIRVFDVFVLREGKNDHHFAGVM
jgi:hypothetical protein